MKAACPHCKLTFHAHDCVTDPGALPEEGDVGVCAECGGWWTIKHGAYVEYTPTEAEMRATIPLIPKYVEMRRRWNTGNR